MKDTVHFLPAAFSPKEGDAVHLEYYRTAQSSQKNRVNFSQNLLCILVEGHKEVFAGSEIVRFDPDKMLFLQAGNTLMTERTVEAAGYHSILFFFSNSFLFDFLLQHKISLDQNGPANGKMLLLKKDNYILNLQAGLSLLEGKSETQAALRNCKLEELFIYLFENHGEAMKAFVKKALAEDRNLRLKQIVNGQEGENLSVSELAFLCNMSLSTFKRRFAEVFEVSPKQYFVRKKMEMALLWLQAGRRPSDIYLELGYENLSSFSNEFKRHFGASPKNFLSQN